LILGWELIAPVLDDQYPILIESAQGGTAHLQAIGLRRSFHHGIREQIHSNAECTEGRARRCGIQENIAVFSLAGCFESTLASVDFSRDSNVIAELAFAVQNILPDLLA
jgi:hypothetical protein